MEKSEMTLSVFVHELHHDDRIAVLYPVRVDDDTVKTIRYCWHRFLIEGEEKLIVISGDMPEIHIFRQSEQP